MKNTQIPLVDLHAQYLTIQERIDAAIGAVIAESAYIGGHRVSDFEAAFAEAQGVKHCIGVGNGTDALYIVMKMLGIGSGDEVITAANSWISTSETVSQTGARPVFVDVDEHFNIDVEKISQAITGSTKAILPVHLYGQPADLDAVRDICAEHNLLFIEDCAQAHLARFHDVPVGNFGAAGTFSFFPGKNLGAYGDGGAIVTNDDTLARHCRMFANHGAQVKHQHEMEGINSRLDGMQAAVLLEKLKHLPEWTEKRRWIADTYTKHLTGIDQLQLPQTAANRTHAFHLYVIRCANRDGLRQHLTDMGVQSGIHYPTPLPMLPAYEYLGHSASEFPNAVRFSGEILSLPIFPELTQTQIEYIVEAIRSFYSA